MISWGAPAIELLLLPELLRADIGSVMRSPSVGRKYRRHFFVASLPHGMQAASTNKSLWRTHDFVGTDNKVFCLTEPSEID